MGPVDKREVFCALLTAGMEALQQGRIAEAEKHFEAAREGEEPLDERDPRFINYLFCLAGTRYAQARYEEADTIALRTLALLQEFVPSPNFITVQMLMLRGDILHLYRGHRVEAERILKDALAMLEKLVDRDHRFVGIVLGKLGLVYHDQGLYDEAEQHLRRAQAIGEQAPGPKDLDLAQTLKYLAKLHAIHHRYHDAVSLLERALAITEDRLGPDHYRVGYILCSLGHHYLHHLPGREVEAGDCYHRAYPLLERAFGPDHPEILSCLDGMATIAQRHGKYRWATRAWMHSLKIVKRCYGPDHRQRATTLMKLAVLFQDQGKYGKAVALYRRTLACLRKALGPDHPQIAGVLFNLAVVYDDRGRLAKAEAFYQRALAISEETLGPEHPQVKGILERYAGLLHKSGREVEALALASRARSIRDQVEEGA
jgi:tetratricopeptide (TPR) repeat protein